MYFFGPDSGETCCSQPMEAIRVSEEAQLFTQSFFNYDFSTTFKYSCQTCSRQLPFDGREVGILNFNNRYLVDIGMESNLQYRTILRAFGVENQ